MKLLAFVLACALTLTSLVVGCQEELGGSCGHNRPCCNEGTETLCIGTCVACADHPSWCPDRATLLTPNQAETSAHLRGAIEAVEFITEDKDRCLRKGSICMKNSHRRCCDDLGCYPDPDNKDQNICQTRRNWEYEDDLA